MRRPTQELLTPEAYLTAFRAEDAGEAIDQGGLSRPVGTDESRDLAGRDGKTDFGQRQQGAEVFG